MVQQINTPALELGGSTAEKDLANQVWNLMRARGSSYANNRPISLTLSMLADYYAGQKYKGHSKPEEVGPLIDKALSASPAVFSREETEVDVPQADDAEAATTRKEVVFKTTKSGKAPVVEVLDQHSFQTRLNQNAKPVLPPTEEELAARMAELAHHPTPSLHLPVAAPQPQLGVSGTQPVPMTAPAAPAPAPRNVPPAAPAAVSAPTSAASAPAPVATTAPKPAATAVPASAPTPVAPPPAARPAQPAATAAPAPAPKPATPAPAPVVTGPIEFEVAEGLIVDLNRPFAEIMAEAGPYFTEVTSKALQDDFRFVNFGNDWYLDESTTGRFNKNDFRRIRDYMGELDGPVSDAAILNDLWGKRTNDHDYEALRFILDYRLLKEKKDFEFVGVPDERIWTAPGLSQIGNPRHKATEIGTDYKFLEDAALNDPSELSEDNGIKVWRHVVTFYEYENGVLPYDATAKQLFPLPMMEEQRSSVLRFEAPQLDFIYTAELRYPTGNRGGWIGGLDQFFVENLVPGAILVISQGSRSNHFIIEYEQGAEQESNVMFYDDRRSRFVFRPVVFACEVNRESMLTSERYSKLNGQKHLEESDRKKTDLVVANAFEFSSPKTAQGYYTLLDDLFPVANIERPFSRNYLRQLLTHGNSQFQADESTPDAFSYKPPTTGVRR